MSQPIYIRNKHEEDNEWWKNILENTVNWENLLKKGDIIKNGSYYPRLKDSKKRGIHAFNEVANKHFQNVDKNYLLGLCRLKVCPVVNLDTLVLNVPDKYNNDFSHFFDLKETKELETSDKPFDIVENDLNVMPSHVKLNQVEDMIENLEFTPLELSSLIKICSNLLIEFHK